MSSSMISSRAESMALPCPRGDSSPADVRTRGITKPLHDRASRSRSNYTPLLGCKHNQGGSMNTTTARAVCIAVGLAFGGSLAFPAPANASLWKKIKKTAKKATKRVTNAVNELEDLTEVGDVALDATASLGKEVKKVGNQIVV